METLVREQLDLIAADLGETLVPDDVKPNLKRCRNCNTDKPAMEFRPGRATCRTCCYRADGKPDTATEPELAKTAAPADELDAARVGLRGERAQQLATGERQDPAEPTGVF